VAVQAATAAFERVISVMEHFAGLAAPAVMFEFIRSLRDLTATVGSAFVPFFNSMIGITRTVAGALYPAMQKLTPFFGVLADVVASRLVPAAEIFASLLKVVAPVLRVFSDVFRAFVPVVNLSVSLIRGLLAPLTGLLSILSVLLSPVFKLFELFGTLATALIPLGPLWDAIGVAMQGLADIIDALLKPFNDLIDAVREDVEAVFEVLGGIFKATVVTLADFIKALIPAFTLKPLIDGLRTAVVHVISALAVFAVKLANLFGFTNFGANLIKALTPNKEFVTAGPVNPAIKGIEDIAKDLALASAIAVGGGGEKTKTQEDLLADVIAAIKAADGGQATGFTTLDKAIGDLTEVVTKVKTVLEQLEQRYDQASHAISAAASGAGVAVASGVVGAAANFPRKLLGI
jgi:hypothetical protein